MNRLKPVQLSSIRQQAIDETKKRGDPERAIALAIVYLADTIAKSKA
jgi:hypothetical protein